MSTPAKLLPPLMVSNAKNSTAITPARKFTRARARPSDAAGIEEYGTLRISFENFQGSIFCVA